MNWLLRRTSLCWTIRKSVVNESRNDLTDMLYWLFLSLSYSLQKCKLLWMYALMTFMFLFTIDACSYMQVDVVTHLNNYCVTLRLKLVP